MIDWLNVVFNLFWITGLAIIVAAFSHNDWLAMVNKIKLKQQLASASFQVPLSIGLTLVSVGLTLLANTWWERLIWVVFVLLFAWQSWQSWQSRRPSV